MKTHWNTEVSLLEEVVVHQGLTTYRPKASVTIESNNETVYNAIIEALKDLEIKLIND